MIMSPLSAAILRVTPAPCIYRGSRSVMRDRNESYSRVPTPSGLPSEWKGRARYVRSHFRGCSCHADSHCGGDPSTLLDSQTMPWWIHQEHVMLLVVT